MPDGTNAFILRMLGRIEEKLDRMLADVSDIKASLSNIERHVDGIRADRQSRHAAIVMRRDRVEGHLAPIERRLDLMDPQ